MVPRALGAEVSGVYTLPYRSRESLFLLDQKQRDDTGVWQYSDRKIKVFTYLVSVMIAAVLPASSMIVLYFIKDTAIRMVTIMVYNIVFSLALGLMVRARRVEIFAAATA